MLVPVYDIKNCGPRHRFVANGKLVHNSDKLNLQNLPSRMNNTLKSSIIAPVGHVLIDCDSSQIEARVLAWVAGQEDLIDAFAAGEDVYKIMASKIFCKPVDEITEGERFLGKTTILGCGFGMGATKFRTQLQGSGVDLELKQCQNIIATYRFAYKKVSGLWRQAGQCLEALLVGQVASIGVQENVVYLGPEGFVMPSGFIQKYPYLQKDLNHEFTYWARNGRVKIYGGKVVENLIQGIARCVIAEQMVWISAKYRPAMTVHDSVVIVAPLEEAEEAEQWIKKCMGKPPLWAPGLPVACKSGVGENYGQC